MRPDRSLAPRFALVGAIQGRVQWQNAMPHKLATRATILASLVACGGALPARNDPAKARSFYCTKSDAKPERSSCTVDDVDACRSTVTVANSEGLFMSQCVAQPWAWCAVGTADKERLFVCAPDEDSCLARRDEAQRRGDFHDTGYCVKRTIGGN